MPLAGPLRAWIAKCKAYAAEHGCSYKEAMSALGGKGKKSHRRKSHRGGAPSIADSAAEYTSGNTIEGAANMGAPGAPTAPSSPPHPPPPPQAGGGLGSAFEVGSMSGGRRRRRRGSKRRGSKRGGSKRRGSKRRGSKRRQSKRGGALSYSEF